tara:strand:- start:861 stop:1334 length:474 start_codon:yes stop_codon:yes gene_type:complete
MLKDAKSKCDKLIVGLQTDPHIDRKDKNKPIQSLEERKIQLEAVKYIDEIIIYETENDLQKLLFKLDPDVRILGSDWEKKPFTGYNLDIPIYFHERTHDYSTSALREKLYKPSLIEEVISEACKLTKMYDKDCIKSHKMALRNVRKFLKDNFNIGEK